MWNEHLFELSESKICQIFLYRNNNWDNWKAHAMKISYFRVVHIFNFSINTKSSLKWAQDEVSVTKIQISHIFSQNKGKITHFVFCYNVFDYNAKTI